MFPAGVAPYRSIGGWREQALNLGKPYYSHGFSEAGSDVREYVDRRQQSGSDVIEYIDRRQQDRGEQYHNIYRKLNFYFNMSSFNEVKHSGFTNADNTQLHTCRLCDASWKSPAYGGTKSTIFDQTPRVPRGD